MGKIQSPLVADAIPEFSNFCVSNPSEKYFKDGVEMLTRERWCVFGPHQLLRHCILIVTYYTIVECETIIENR